MIHNIPVKKIISYTYRGLAVTSIIIASCYGGLYLSLQQKSTQGFLQEKINQHLPFRIQFDKVRFQWRGINPGFSMKNVSVYADDSSMPNLFIEQVFGFINLPTLIYSKKHAIDELTLVGTDIALETQDYLQYHIKSIPQLGFSLDDNNSEKWMERFRFVDSNVIIEHPKYKYKFTQTDILIAPNEPLPVIGHATYIGDDGKPCFINFKHLKNVGSAQHQWMISFFGSLEHIDNLFMSHDLVIRDDLVTEGNAYALAWITQDKEEVDFYIHTNIQSLNATYDDMALKADVFEASIVGKKTKDEWWFAAKDLKVQNAELNAVDMTLLPDLQLFVKKKVENDGTIWELKTAHLPVSFLNEAKTLIHKFKPQFIQYPVIETHQGQLAYLNAEFYTDATQTALRTLKADFKNISVNIPEKFQFQNLTGQISFENNQGKVKLISQSVAFFQDQWFLEPLIFDTVEGVLFLDTINHQFVVSGHELNLGLDQTRINSSFQVNFPEVSSNKSNNSDSPILDLVMHVEDMPVVNVKSYLPIKKMNSDLYDWLAQGLEKGNLTQGTLVCRGAVNQFPFDKSQGVFQAYAQLEGVNLKFAPDWPALTDSQVELVFNNRSLYAKSHQSNILDVPVKMVTATIQNLTAKPALLTATVHTKSTLQNGLRVIEHSSLKEKIGNPLNTFELAGAMDMKLNLSIPLSKQRINDIKVQGTIDTNEAQFNFAKQNIRVQKAKGQIKFTKDSLSIEKLFGNIWGKPTEFRMKASLKEDGMTHIHAKGKVDAHNLIASNQPMLKQVIQGVTDYVADFHLHGFDKNQYGKFTVHSDLVGVTLNLPEPFNKSKEAVKEVTITGILQSDHINQYQIKTSDYHIALGFDTKDSSQSQFLGGHLNLGKEPLAKFKKDGKLLIDGQVKQLDAKKLFDWYKVNKQKASRTVEIEPKINLKLETLDLFGILAQEAHIEGGYDKKLDNILFSIQSKNVNGFASLPKQDPNRVIVVDLETLYLPEPIITQVFQGEELKRGDNKKPLVKNPLEIKIKHLVYRDKKINFIHAQLEPMSYGYHIKNFDFNLGEAQIDATGYWHYLSGKSQTDITGKIKTRDISSAMEALGLKSTVKKAKGEADFALSWEGYPFQVNLPSLSGEMKFKFKDGVIQGVNPGFGRILSLLNIDNLRRRINFDFSDVTKDGMTFDTLTGTMHLLDGVLHSDKVILDSASVKIETTFRASLETQTLNGHVDVMPNLTGSLPIAAAIAAGNPAVGAAVWVMDKLFGKHLQEINRYQYRLMGTWDNPIIEEMNVKKARRDFGRG